MLARRATVHDLVLLTTLSFATGRSLRAESTSDWQTRAFAEISAREYEVTWQDGTALAGARGAWQAPNRAQGLRSYFTETGLRVAPRLDEERAWEWGLTLVRYGRPGIESSPLTAPRLSPRGNRVDRDWGGIVEWYVNDARGVEHGFTLQTPPEGRAGEAHIDLALAGGLHPSFSDDGQAIVFRVPGGPSVLRYGELVVVDARGRSLPARMEGFATAGVRGVRLVFDDRDAVYPVTIDPLATSAAWNGEGNQANGSFGISVATAGDVNGDGYSDVVVGAEKFDNGQVDEGRTFLYLGQPSGLAAASAWTAESNQTSALFGGVVAAAGDVNGDGFADVVVGCRQFDNGYTDEGRVYVYLGSASGLSPTAFWTDSGGQESAFFGGAVATAGDVNGDGYADVVVGASEFEDGQPDEGRAYVYYGSPSSLTLGWTAEGNQAAAYFGGAVATAGDVNGDGFAEIIVSARLLDAGQADEGRVYVFFGSGSGLAAVAGWKAESNQAFANFGVSVGTAGDVNGDGYADVVVGASLYDNGQTDEGRGYLYLGSDSGLALSPAWTVESDQAGAGLGIAVATAGDVNGDGYADVIVGASMFDNGQADEGRATVYLGSATGLATSPFWTAETDAAGAQFGASVATAGDVNGDGYSDVVVGAPLASNGQAAEGRAYLYLGAAGGLTANENWAVDINVSVAFLGWSVASAGDVNGDGYDDVVVGARTYNSSGRAFLYLGSASGLAVTHAWSAAGGSEYGASVASAGDVNGDGYDDVIVGAFYANPGGGAAYLYLGSPSGLGVSPAWTAFGGQTFSFFGKSVASAGDVNGDGFADVIVGAEGYSNGQGSEGRAYLYLGSAAGLSATAAWIVESDKDMALFGSSVASAGDVNRDGYSDVIVGATDYEYQTDGGRAFVYLGSASGLSATPVWSDKSGSFSGHYGGSVASAGDVNGDGFSDIVVGVWNVSNPLGFVGRALVYLGSPTGPSPTFDTALNGDASPSDFGFSVASAGDVNGDGFSDVVVGSRVQSQSAGKTFLYLGSASGLTATPAWTRVGPQINAEMGYSVASAGDVNGDGFSDVLVGAPRFNNGQSSEGLALLYYGNGGRGREYAPLQVRANGTALIQLLGKSESSSSFRLFGLQWSAAGRSRVRVQTEVKPLGTPFNGAGLRQGETADTLMPVPGAGSRVYFNQLIDQLAPATPYRWRLRVVSDSPFFPTSRWISAPGNSPTETDLRTTACIDLDGDGYGAPAHASCPAGAQLDCDDAHASAHPGALETCDGLDNNCNGTSDDVQAPVGSPSLVASRAGADVQLSWSSIPNATRYDVVRGQLTTLRTSGGNFTTAIDQCVFDDRNGDTVNASGTPVGDGLFFLVRGTVGTCADGTYNTGAPSQIGSRDAEIDASAAACP